VLTSVKEISDILKDVKDGKIYTQITNLGDFDSFGENAQVFFST
jgi:hypothetical protein